MRRTTEETSVVCIIGVYRKLAVVAGWLGLWLMQGCSRRNKVSWSGLVVNTIGGAANATRGKFLALESCRETLIFVRVGPAGRGSRGLAVHTFIAVYFAVNNLWNRE